MELLSTCNPLYFSDIVRIYPRAWHNYNPAVSLSHQPGYQFAPFQCLRLLPRCKQPVTTETDDLFQCPLRIAAQVESPVECNRHSLCRLDKTLTDIHIDISVRGQCADHDSVHAHFPAIYDIRQHCSDFRCVVAEISFTRADKDIDSDTVKAALFLSQRHGSLHRFRNQAATRRHTTATDCRTEFYTYRTAIKGLLQVSN